MAYIHLISGAQEETGNRFTSPGFKSLMALDRRNKGSKAEKMPQQGLEQDCMVDYEALFMLMHGKSYFEEALASCTLYPSKP